MGEVGAEDSRATRAAQGSSEVTRAATQVEGAGVFFREDAAKTTGHAAPPEAVHVEGEKMVQEIVARRDSRKHFADVLRRLAF
jgi:hypothetical protein